MSVRATNDKDADAQKHLFPVNRDFVNGSFYVPHMLSNCEPSEFGRAVSRRAYGLEALFDNYQSATTSVVIPQMIRFFEDVSDDQKNSREKNCNPSNGFDVFKAVQHDVLGDFPKKSKSAVIMAQPSVKRTVEQTVQQKLAVMNLLNFTKLSKTLKNDSKIVKEMLDDAKAAESIMLAATVPNNVTRVAQLVDMLSQRAPRTVQLPAGTACFIDGCESEDRPETLFKLNYVCTNHESCIEKRMDPAKICKCDDVAFCKHCLCNHLVRLFKVAKPGVCPQCNKEFCLEDLIQFQVARSDEKSAEKPSKRAKKN